MKGSRWTGYLVDILLLLALGLLFFWPDITPNAVDRRSFAPGDFAHQFYAFARYEASRLHAGELPLWAPYAYGGHPFLADIQSAVFYPFSLLTMALTGLRGQGFPYHALELEALLHYPLAAIFTYLLARRLTGSRLGGLVAAIAFTFSAYLTSYPPLQLAILETVAWLPLILLLLDLAVASLHLARGTRALGWAVAAGLGLGVALLAGHPQSSLLLVYAAVAYAVFRLAVPESSDVPALAVPGRPAWKHPLLAGLGLIAVFLVIGAGVAAIQLWPSWEFMRLSTRADMGYVEAGGGFHPYDLLQLILPAVGVPVPALYLGILPVGLAAAGLAYGLRRDERVRRTTALVLFWAGLGLVGLLISFGRNLPVYQLFYHLAPGWGLFRHQERTILWTVLSVSMLAGYGAAWWGSLRGRGVLPDWDRRLWRTLIAGFGLAALCALGLALAFFYRYQLGDESQWGFTAAGLFLALTLALSALAVYSRVPLVLLGVLVLDLFTLNVSNHSTAGIVDPYPSQPVLEAALADSAQFRVANDNRLPLNYGLVYGVEDLSGASPLQLAAFGEMLDNVPRERLWQLLGVKYVLTWEETLATPARLVGTGAGKDGEPAYLHELAVPGARAWLAGEVVVEPERNRVWQLLAATDFDATRQVILDELPAELGPGHRDCQGTVMWEKHLPESLALAVENSGTCVLVLGELAYPGWQAAVDGRPVPMLQANGALRGIVLEPGQHRVTMIFRPQSFTWGAVVSAVVLVLALVALVLAFARRGTAETQSAQRGE